MRAWSQAAQQWLKELTQLLELIGVQQLASIKHHGFELGALAGDPWVGFPRAGAIAEHSIGELRRDSADVGCQSAPPSNNAPSIGRKRPACQRSSRTGDGSPNAPTSRWPIDELAKSI